MLDTQDIANTIPYIMLFFALSLNILILCYFSELLNSQVFIKETGRAKWECSKLLKIYNPQKKEFPLIFSGAIKDKLKIK